MTAGLNADVKKELERLRQELEDANMTLDAIRTGQVDALLVDSAGGPQLFTLNSADQTYRFFIEQMREGAITLNQEGLILFSNSQFAQMVDLPLSDVAGQHLSGFILPDDRERFTSQQTAAWTDTCKGEYLLTRTTGRIPVLISMSSLMLESGKSMSVLVTDLTEQKAAQDALRHSNEQLVFTNRALEASNHDLQQFASVASHDLQEPVRKIHIFSTMLKESGTPFTVAGNAYLEKVIKAADRMRSLIVDILNYSGLSSRQSPYEPVRLNDIVVSLLDDFELVIRDSQAEIKISEFPVVFANAGQIRQVFQNLFSNALKFTRQGVIPVIAVSCRRIASLLFDAPDDENGDYFLISFEDNGIGFPDEYAENIFSLFERLNGKDKYEGTGIGLAIARKIVEKHGGLIAARGRPGEGAVFSFIIPAGLSKQSNE